MSSSHAIPDNTATRIDGRTARSTRTRSAIADALYEILREGHGDANARAIADRAGVSTRSVFQHFDDLEAVYTEVSRRQEAAIRPFLAPIDADVPLIERIDRLVTARDEMYAVIAPVRHSLNMHRTARTSQLVRNNLARLRRGLREQIAATFPHEIAGDERLLVQIDVWLSFESWDQFTSQHGLSRQAARGHLAGLVQSLLAR